MSNGFPIRPTKQDVKSILFGHSLQTNFLLNLDIIERFLQNWTGCEAQLRQCIEELRKKERLVNK